MMQLFKWISQRQPSPTRVPIYTFDHCLRAAAYPDARRLKNALDSLAEEGTFISTEQVQQLAATVISQGQAVLLSHRFGDRLNENSRDRLLTLIETNPHILNEPKYQRP